MRRQSQPKHLRLTVNPDLVFVWEDVKHPVGDAIQRKDQGGGCVGFILSVPLPSILPFQGSQKARCQIVLWFSGRYTAQALQVNPSTAGVTPAHPIAVSPSGPTTTDTVSHVVSLENAQTDVTTKFVGDAIVERNDPKVVAFDSPTFIKAATTEYIMTLKKALCRPIQIASGTWSTADVAGTYEYAQDCPKFLTTLNIVGRKLDGFQGVRGSVTVRLLASANPFQQGILRLSFYPMWTQDATVSQRALVLESSSFWPAVELNLGKDTACEMRIPYVLPVNWIDLVGSTGTDPQMGRVFIQVYSPLKVGSGSTTVSWNLYAHWNEDDLELFNPTPNIYQSGHHPVAKGPVKLPTDKEKKSSSISGGLDAVAELSEVASAIPVLSAVAGPTAWAARCASKVASAFGFSRPALDSKPQMVRPDYMPYNTNVEGPDVALPLSLTVEPSLKFEPKLAGKNEDEMSIDYFVTKFGFQQTITFDSTATPGNLLMSYKLGPAIMTANETTCPKPFQLLGLLFHYWRGNFRFRFKFVKTKMHTARLMFAFVPGVVTNLTLPLSEYTHREVVDLATIPNEELVYELPYCGLTPYLKTTTTDLTGCYGTFQILVVNTLQAPSTVSSSVTMIVETAMGEGSEWVCPDIATSQDLVPNAGTTIPSSALKPIYKQPNVPQSGGSTGLVRVTTLSDAQTTGHQVETAQLCVGEKVMSLRQLIKLPADMSFTLMGTVATANATGYCQPVYFNPNLIGCADTFGGNAIKPRDFMNILGGFFRFNRGSMRVRCYNDFRTGTYDVGFNPLVCTTATLAQNPGMVGFDTFSAHFAWNSDIAEGRSLRSWTLPPWQGVPFVANHYATAATAADTSTYAARMALRQTIFGMGRSGSAAVGFHFLRQPADDFEFLFFVGPPVFVVAS